MHTITTCRTTDAHYDLRNGAGSDAMHTNPQYGYAVTHLETDHGITGTGLAFTLGAGTNLVCEAVQLLIEPLLGREIEELMADFGAVQRQIAERPSLRWLGPHKGVIHMALASITNACFDLWAKARGVPLWKLLLDLDPRATAQAAGPELLRRRAVPPGSRTDPAAAPAHPGPAGGMLRPATPATIPP